MNTINIPKINTILSILENADSYTLDDSNLIQSFTMEDPVGDKNNEILKFTWDDEKGQEFSVKFTEQSVSDATVDSNGNLQLFDNDGDPNTLCVFELSKVNFTGAM